LRILKRVNKRKRIYFYFLLYFQEKRRLSKDEITLTVPTTEILRRMSQDDISPIHQSLSNDNTQSPDLDQILYILIFLYEIILFLFNFHVFLF
jgi:hypothetical protein